MSDDQCPFCAGMAIDVEHEPGIVTTKFVCRTCGHSWWDLDDDDDDDDPEATELRPGPDVDVR